MKTITKMFYTFGQAEKYQNRLYNKYNHVELIRVPVFGERGLYMWSVK